MTSPWKTLPLWSLATVGREVVEPTDLGVEVVHYSIPSVDATGTGQVEESESIQSAKLRLRGGEVLISKLNPRKSRVLSVAKSAMPIVSSTEFVGLRAGSALDSRYLAYLLQSESVRQELDSRVQSVTRSHQRVAPEDITHLNVAVPPVGEQRRIADFLDAETARMSALRDSLHQFDRDVRERERAVLADQLNAGARSVRADLPPSWQWTPLMHLTDPLRQIMYGIVLPGPNVADGVPIVKGGDVAANRLSLKSLNRTTREIEAGYARSRLKGGDLVIAIRGSVGEVAVVPDELTGANLTQDAARISIERSVHARWLRLVLESPVVTHQIQQRVTGATIKGINIWDLKRVFVPTPDIETQAALATTVGRAIQTHEDLRSRVAQHDRLLAERRQALITAAVTGQLDVTTASGRNVTDGVTA
ncbi:hypothetical protein [Streptomyces sp. NPDC059262]|uniref:restriction endonuclease subunit S n=1 Tax=Streptomyces sp. NPDC059262 TaxID=3346797 RepID=UPI00368D9856